MIIKSVRGGSAAGLLRYQRRLGGTPEEQAGVRFFDKQGIHDVENAAAVLDRLAARSGCENQIVHIIIRAERGLSDAEWRITKKAALDEAGLSNRAHIAFLHDHDNDHPGDHMHIAAVAVDRDGKPPPRFLRSESLGRRVTREEAETLPRGDVRSRAWDSQLRRRLMSTARILEDQLGLRQLARDRARQIQPITDELKVSQGARDRERRTGIPSLADLLDPHATRAALDELDYTARADALAKLDLELRPFVRKNGATVGLRLHRLSEPRLHCPVSTLGGYYSLKAMDQRSPVAFAVWYNNGPRVTSTAPAISASKDDPLFAQYEQYKRDAASRQREIRAERNAVIAWRKHERAKAFKRRMDTAPVGRTRSGRALRAAATVSYHMQCAQIDAEAVRQHGTLDGLSLPPRDYIDWLASIAEVDQHAAAKYAELRKRGIAASDPAIWAFTTPTLTKPAATTLLSSSERAAIVAEQERLTRQADELMAGAAILNQASAVNKLVTRLQAIGVRLILDADRQNRRVRIQPDAVDIDGTTMMTVHPTRSIWPVLDQARTTQATQLMEERRLPDAIRSAMCIPAVIDETPTAFLERIGAEPRSTRWITPAQDASIRLGWKALIEQAPKENAAIVPGPQSQMEPQAPVFQPIPAEDAREFVQPTIRPAAAPPGVVSADTRNASNPSPVRKPHAQIDEAMAMMKMQRPAPSKIGHNGVTPAKVVSSPARDVQSTQHPALPETRTASSQARLPVDSPPQNATTKPPSAVAVQTPSPILTPSLPSSEHTPRVSEEANLIAQWLLASDAARLEPSRQPKSDELAARLVASADLEILDWDVQARAKREAHAHKRRLAQEADVAREPSPSRPAQPALPDPPLAKRNTAANPLQPISSRTAVQQTEQQRAAQLKYVYNRNDPLQRS